MYISIRTDRNGIKYFSVRYKGADGKMKRLKKSEHPDFKTEEEAEEWCKSQDAIKQSKKNYIKQKTQWKTKYYNFVELLKLYERYQKKNAPNSWQRSVKMVEQHVFHFFLDIKGCSNPNDWYLLFRDFRDWVDEEMVNCNGKKTDSYSTKNHAINSLNTFLECLGEYRKIDQDSVKRIKPWPKSLIRTKDHRSVISHEDFEKILVGMNNLTSMDENQKIGIIEFFRVLRATGMRINELWSIPFCSLHRGKIKGPVHDSLVQKNMDDYFGYFLLKSQCKTVQRLPNDRKPLKHRPTISPKYYRSIPIFSKEIWNIVARRYLVCDKNFKKNVGSDSENYHLFDGEVSYSQVTKTFKEVCERLGFANTPHDLRHTFVTEFVGQTRDLFLVRAITGHKSEKTLEYYLHTYEMMMMMNEQKENVIEII